MHQQTNPAISQSFRQVSQTAKLHYCNPIKMSPFYD